MAISAVVEMADDVDLWVDLLVELDGGTARAAEHRAAVLHRGALQHRDDDDDDCEDCSEKTLIWLFSRASRLSLTRGKIGMIRPNTC